jgi:hypothetical protein
MWSISDFAKAVKARGSRRSNALLIGFEGSARLMGNELAAVALTQLQLSSTGTSLNTNEIQRAWRSAGAEGQYLFLKSAFGARQPNIAAIQNLACLIREAHIGVIVATDPIHALHQELVKVDVIDAYAMFNCCQNKVDLLAPMRENLRDRPLFIDGGEVLIDGLIPGLYGLNHQDSQLIYETLRKTSTGYDKTICWGWSNFNTSVEKFWTSESGRYFVLGKDSENNRTFLPDASMDIVALQNQSQSDIASLNLLQAVAEELCPGSSAAKLQAETQMVSSAQMGNLQNTQPSYASPLLCDERAADGLIRESRQKSLAVIGVDSAVVRSRLASLLGRLIVKNRDLLEHEPISRLEEISERVTSFEEEPENLFWVVEFVGGSDLSLLAQPFYRELAISLTTNPKLKTLLLVPSFYAAEIERSARGVNLHAETLTFEKVFVPERLRAWLKEVFPELEGEEESLAEEMCRVAYEMDGEWTSNGGLDGIHLALNRWWRSVEFTQPDMTDFEHLLEMWRESLECFAGSSGEFQDEGDWGIRPRSLSDDVDEWELRVVSRPRREPGPQQS